MRQPSGLQPTGYTTALKQLQIMAVKKLVDRDESERSHVYRARLSEDATQRFLVGDLMQRAFGGSAERLVMQAARLPDAGDARRARDPFAG